MKIRIIKVRSCGQCGEILSQKCPKCTKHPDRKPKIVTYYPLPKSSEVCACGQGVKVVCQIPEESRPSDCKRIAWKSLSNAQRGRVIDDLFCGRHCASIATGLSRRKRQTVICSNPECDRANGRRKSFELRQCYILRNATPDHYCCTSCRWIHFRLKKLQEVKIEQVPILPKVVTADEIRPLPRNISSAAGRLLSSYAA